MKVTDQQIIEAAQSSLTMREAAIKIGLHESSFIPRAKRLGVYNTNQSRKGITKLPHETAGRTIPIAEILEGKHPQYGTSHLKRRLFKERIKQEKCEGCGITDGAVLQLDHKNGDSTDHRLINLQILCANCHSLTSTFAGKNKAKAKRGETPDIKLLDGIISGLDTTTILNSSGMVSNGVNYRRVDKLRKIVDYLRGKI